MTDTDRRLFVTDEHGQLYMHGPDSPYATAGSLKDHGLDVPAELVDAYEEAIRIWEETQKRLQAWFESVAPSETTVAEFLQREEFLQRDIFESVVLYQERTWDQYEAFPSCDHAEAVERLRSKDDPAKAGGETCRRCGSHVAWVRRAYNEETRRWEDLQPPYEIQVLA